ncbi:MAG: ABC transporter substrate-binding protein [Gammaproteobacteria bacterium]|nr:ABC transporter substrate-binding protein [Gammaproteobacteria bacterium]
MILKILRTGFLLLFLAGSSPIIAEEDPKTQLKSTIDAILDTLRNKKLATDERQKKITDLINDRFDFAKMSQQTLAINWKKASKEQKNKFIELFAKSLQSSYMGRLEAYTNETVEFTKEKIKNKKAKINTLIITKTIEIPINYKLHNKNNKWLIYDVVIEEVSLIRSYRSSYQNIVKKEGIEGLLTKMEKKLAGAS